MAPGSLRFTTPNGSVELRRAVASPEPESVLAHARRLLGDEDLEAAGAILRAAPEVVSSTAEGAELAGIVEHRCGRPAAAIAHFEQAIRIAPDNHRVRTSLASALARSGDGARALDLLDRVVGDAPGIVEAHYNRGCVHLSLDRFDEAIEDFAQTTRMVPDFVEAWSNLGVALKEANRLEEAGDVLRRVIDRWGDDPSAWRRGEVTAADAWRNLSNVLLAQGLPEPAIDALDRALGHDPSRADLESSALLYGACLGRSHPRGGLDAARAWARRHAAPDDFTPAGEPLDGRRVRVGYLSADLREHPVGRFIEPVLAHHDRERFEVFVYCDVAKPDAETGRLAEGSERWRDTHALDDAGLVDAVRADRLDVLVDLGGHSPRNRMRALSRRLAPVQLTWLGHVGTTGVDAIDYLVASEHLISPAMEADFSENILRLEHAHWCYAPSRAGPPVAPSPAMTNGHVTFGCFNHPAKLSRGALAAWSRILDAVADSRLLLKFYALEDAATRERLRGRLAEAGIGPERVSFEPGASFTGYLAAYGSIDIALDPFPYAGGTVTCDALWMGVPTVSVEGDTLAGRLGSASLRAAGLDELVSADVDGYVDTAVRLAADRDRLVDLRSNLRERIARSPLGDARTFTRNIERALEGLLDTGL